MSDKIYVGSGKKISGQYGEFRKVSLCLNNIPEEHVYEYNGKKYISLLVNDKKEKDQFGKDISVTVDTWKPEQQTQSQEQPSNQDFSPPKANDDLPF